MIMRELKFRAWHKNQKEMYEVFSFCHAFTKICIGIGTASEKIPNNLLEPLMQYTGLKDKNGKNIYENDIVRILYTDWGSKSDNDPRTLEQYLIDISEIGVVEFNDNAWEVKMYSEEYDDYSHSSISYGTHGRIEVIGNIHENPELLKQHGNKTIH